MVTSSNAAVVMAEEKPLVELLNISVIFGSHKVHRDVSFKINRGEVVVLLGPSGTGKTVLLKLIIGLLSPTEGRVFVHGRDLETLSEEELRKERLKIGMLFQGAALFDSLSVYENIAFPLREHGEISEEKIRSVVKEKLLLVDLPEVEQKFPPELSGGQKKRVGLARALATNPEVLLFDEPTTGLDPSAKGIIDNLILMLKARYAITSIVVTHDMDSAKKIADRLVLLNDGHVVVDGPAAKLWSENKQIASFVAGEW